MAKNIFVAIIKSSANETILLSSVGCCQHYNG